MGLRALIRKETREIISPYSPHIGQNYTICTPRTNHQQGQPNQYLPLNWIDFIEGIHYLKSLLNEVFKQRSKEEGDGYWVK